MSLLSVNLRSQTFFKTPSPPAPSPTNPLPYIFHKTPPYSPPLASSPLPPHPSSQIMSPPECQSRHTFIPMSFNHVTIFHNLPSFPSPPPSLRTCPISSHTYPYQHDEIPRYLHSLLHVSTQSCSDLFYRSNSSS